MDYFDAVESEWTTVPIAEKDARELRTLGERLASDQPWWGDESDSLPEVRSAIHCRMTPSGTWQVRVAERVGIVSTGRVAIRVLPKIPTDHALFLMREGVHGLAAALSLDDAKVAAEEGAGFWEVVCQAFINATEAVVRADLVRDYRIKDEELAVVRGRLAVGGTTRNLLQGVFRFDCEYADFSADVPINRLLKAASGIVVRSPILAIELRRRAMRIRAHMTDVGDLQPGDRRAIVLDRRTANYRDAIELAEHVLAAREESWHEGIAPAVAFLIRTPLLIQKGIQVILGRVLGPRWPVRPEKVLLGGIPEYVNPDLVFGAREGVADVKYKIASSVWNRADLYEVVAFAEHLGARRAALIDFGNARRARVRLGDIEITQVPWDLSLDAETAASRFTAAASAWLTTPLIE